MNANKLENHRKQKVANDLVSFFNTLLNPIVLFWLHHTVHCTEKIVFCTLRTGSTLAERVGQGEVGGVNCRVTLLGLAVKCHGWDWVGQLLLWLHEQA